MVLLWARYKLGSGERGDPMVLLWARHKLSLIIQHFNLFSRFKKLLAIIVKTIFAFEMRKTVIRLKI